MSYRLQEDYPVEVQAPPETEITPGLRRHMPIGYDELGRYREPRRPFPGWLAFAIVLGAVMVARAVL